MGNHRRRFRLLDLIPNSWLYKLKDMSSRGTRHHNTPPTKRSLHPPPPATSLSSLPSTSSSSPRLPQPSDILLHQLLSTPPLRRKSYYFTRDLIATPPHNVSRHRSDPKIHAPDPPRKSSKKRRSIKRIHRNSSARLVTSTVPGGCSCRATIESLRVIPGSASRHDPNSSSSENESLLPEFGSEQESFAFTVSHSSADTYSSKLGNGVVLDTNSLSSDACPCKLGNGTVNSFSSDEKLEKLDFPLTPIVTKSHVKKEKSEPTKIRRSTAKIEERNEYGSLSVKIVKEHVVGIPGKERGHGSPVRKFSMKSPGLKLRTNSPRFQVSGRKSSSSSSRRSLSDSFAVVKASKDPQKDFKESMVEMIRENNIRASKDLEDLLACYLSLNSDEYHEMIIKVFKQIWFDVFDIRLK